jgi:hypothetical protein
MARIKHGHAFAGKETSTYHSWCHMIERCNCSTNHAYADYGGRGIQVCERWLSFENFLADMGEAPPGKSIDRWPDNDGNYEPGNCRWATPKEQAEGRRMRRDNRSGFTGVHQQKGRWIATRGKLYIGIFDTPEEASAARSGEPIRRGKSRT